MNTHIALLVAACTLAMAACGKSPPASETPAPAATAEPAPAATPDPAPNTSVATAPTPVTPAPASEKPAAVVADCSTQIEGTDAMQYNVGSITVPASCKQFKITLKHAGQMPVAAMGHNVVIAKESDMQAVLADGMAAGISANYVKADDARVIAHTTMVGGGQTTSVSVLVSKLKADGPTVFFCSFPGHAAMMKGSIAVE
jgi:azurin